MKEEEVKSAKLKMMEGFMGIMLKASGMDVVAPAPLKCQALHSLDLLNDKRFEAIEDLFEPLEGKERLNMINALILTQLRPTEMVKVRDTISLGVSANLHYLQGHPEYTEKPEKLDFEGLFGGDLEDE